MEDLVAPIKNVLSSPFEDIFQGMDYTDIANYFKYSFKSKSKYENTSEEVTNYLFEKISLTLCGHDITRVDFKKIKNHIIIESFINEDVSTLNLFSIIEIIWSATNKLSFYTKNIEQWKEARIYVLAYLSITPCFRKEFREHSYNKEKNIATSIKWFKQKNIKLDIKNGLVYFEHGEENKILSSIEYRAKKLGNKFVGFVICKMNILYNKKQERYFYRKLNNNVSQMPWGYIFNLSLSVAHIKNNSANKENEVYWKELVQLSINYLAVYDFQEYGVWDSLFQNKDTILNTIQRNIIFDQIFKIDQLSNQHTIAITKGIFEKFESELKSVINFELFTMLMDFIHKNSNIDKAFVFSLSDMPYTLKSQYKKEEIKEILDIMSCEITQLNKGYKSPLDVKIKNYFSKPLVKINNEQYSFLNAPIFNYGFYDVILEKLDGYFVSKRKMADLLGKATEIFIEKCFNDSKISVLANKHYKIDKNLAKNLNIKRYSGECDFIVETQSTIIFIELKRKELTKESRSGDIIQSVFDLALSNFFALKQSGWHEIILKHRGRINFTDGSCLILD